MDTSLKKLSGFTLSYIVLIFFLCIYLIFPSGFSTSDGWNYAANIKHSGEIFLPYHLLYNGLGYLFCYLPVKAGADTLDCLKIMNAFFAVLALFAVQLIMRKLSKSELIIIIVSCLSGVSFAVIRYATENETYIVPLSLALLALYCYIWFLQSGSNKYIIFSGLLVSVSILFHLEYLFWWVALLIGVFREKKKYPLLWYLIVSLLVPIVYSIVIYSLYCSLDRTSVSAFVLDEFSKSAHFELSLSGLFFTVVNLGRSFIQVHGYMFNMISRNIFLAVPGLISLIFFIMALFSLTSRIKGTSISGFNSVLFSTIVFTGLFAMLAEGNAEFMVMIPVLSFILIPLLFSNCERFLIMIMLGMLIWNVSYGLIPLNLNSSATEDYLCEKALNENNSMIIASNDQLLKSMVFYRSGVKNINNIVKSPALLSGNNNKIRNLEILIDSALSSGAAIYTDCLGQVTISRASIIEGNSNKDFFSQYSFVQVKVLESILGTRAICRITGRISSPC
jgi:hypothetical protein